MSRMRRNRTLLLARSGARQPFLLALGRLQIHDPYPPAGRVVGPVVVLDHRAPGLERAHGERDSLEVVASVAKHFVGVPVVGENGVASMHAQDSVIAIKRCFRSHVTRGAAFLAFRDDVAFLSLRFDFGFDRRSGSASFGVHIVCATASACAAEAILTKFFASAAWIRASGNWTPIMRHCSLANFCNVAMCSAWRWPKRPCNFKYSDTGRILAGRKL